MTLENKVNISIVHGLTDADSKRIKKVEEEVLKKGLTLKFSDEQYQVALDLLKRFIYREVGDNKLRMGKTGYRMLQEKGVQFNYV